MLEPTPNPEAVVYQLRVILRGVSPLIWRRLLVRSDSTIADLHATFQLALGWSDEHLNRFVIHGHEYGVWHDGGIGFRDDPRHVRLANLVCAAELYAHHSAGLDDDDSAELRDQVADRRLQPGQGLPPLASKPRLGGVLHSLRSLRPCG
jgi:Plasmid pRiA4b ORF-3-like protein